MSADNYYFVGKTEEGKFSVSHRFASTYYRDEIGSELPKEDVWLEGSSDGWKIRGSKTVYATLEEVQAAIPTVPEEWICDAPKPRSIHDTLEEAVMAAHRYVKEDDVVEYGVCVAASLL